MRRVTMAFEQWAARVLCVIALVFVAFAHQVPVLAEQAEDFSAYLLPDGTLPTLCVKASDEDGGKDAPNHKLHTHGCEACRIGTSVMLPFPTDVVGVDVAFAVFAELQPRVESFHRQIHLPKAGPRDPPADPLQA
jgi:hypothetical protein